MAAALILLAIVPVILWQWYHRPPAEFESFWGPAFDRPLVVAIAPTSGGSVSFADADTAFQLARLFGTRPQLAAVRLTTELDTTSAAIFVGANRRTAELTQKLRFALTADAPSITDTTNAARHWSTEDCVLICRLVQGENGKFTMIAAGKQAGRILAGPGALVPILKQLPANWEKQNVEVVLQSKGTAVELIDKQVWQDRQSK